MKTANDLDPLMYCSPRYFAFNQGIYELTIKDLLGIVKVMVQSFKGAAKDAPLNLNA